MSKARVVIEAKTALEVNLGMSIEEFKKLPEWTQETVLENEINWRMFLKRAVVGVTEPVQQKQ